MDARSILGELREARAPSPEQLRWFAIALAEDQVDDAQAGAFAMGLCRSPLSVEARVALTLAMRDTGKVLKWDLPGPVMDKHSTGGVGDPLSLILGPTIAALGGYIPMLSGRGLGHTGGTLDKLESIPGVKTDMDETRFRHIVTNTGCALAAATSDIAPADKRLYAVRDTTATVDSIDLITASILSKKLAGGVGPLVLDVKTGSGAIMGSLEEATALAESLVGTANGAAGPAAALITDMNQPCVPSVGNALEIMEVMRVLTDATDCDEAFKLTTALGGELLHLAAMVDDPTSGTSQLGEAIASGDAAERFGQMIAAMGGPADFLDRWPDRLPSSPVVRELKSTKTGYISAIDGRALGMAVVRLGGGRMRASDRIDPAVGLSDLLRIGDKVGAGDVVGLIHGRDADQVEALAKDLGAAFDVSNEPVAPPKLIKGRVT